MVEFSNFQMLYFSVLMFLSHAGNILKHLNARAFISTPLDVFFFLFHFQSKRMNGRKGFFHPFYLSFNHFFLTFFLLPYLRSFIRIFNGLFPIFLAASTELSSWQNESLRSYRTSIIFAFNTLSWSCGCSKLKKTLQLKIKWMTALCGNIWPGIHYYYPNVFASNKQKEKKRKEKKQHRLTTRLFSALEHIALQAWHTLNKSLQSP